MTTAVPIPTPRTIHLRVGVSMSSNILSGHGCKVQLLRQTKAKATRESSTN